MLEFFSSSAVPGAQRLHKKDRQIDMQRERKRVRREQERDLSSSSSSYIGINVFMRTQNLDGIKE